MAALPRVVSILIAYAASCAVAGAVLVLAVTILSGRNSSGGPYDLELFIVFVSLVGLIAGIVALASLLPVSAAIIYAERNGVRSWSFYAAAGAAAGIVGVVLYLAVLWFAPGSGGSISDFDAALVTGIAGLVVLAMVAGVMSGSTYWAIAGRNAGAPS